MKLDKTISRLDANNHLIFDTRPMLDRQFMLSNWSVGIKFYINSNDDWVEECIEPALVLVNEEHTNDKTNPIYHFLKLIPNWIVSTVIQYQYMQFSLLSLLSQFPIIHDIFKHSPNLCWLVVIESVNKSWTPEYTIKLLMKKRQNILAEVLGVASSSALVKLLNKIKLFDGSQLEYMTVIATLKENEVCNGFIHWHTIPVQALYVVRRYPIFINSYVLKNENYDNGDCNRKRSIFAKYEDIARDIAQMATALNMRLPRNYVGGFKTFSALKNAHDQFVYRFNQQEIERVSHIEFPICPLKNTDNYIQLTTARELMMEGKTMHHCVGGYIEQAEKGECYFYQALEPERGTIKLIYQNKKFSIDEFKLACNKSPSEESWFAVKQWLS